MKSRKRKRVRVYAYLLVLSRVTGIQKEKDIINVINASVSMFTFVPI